MEYSGCDAKTRSYSGAAQLKYHSWDMKRMKTLSWFSSFRRIIERRFHVALCVQCCICQSLLASWRGSTVSYVCLTLWSRLVYAVHEILASIEETQGVECSPAYQTRVCYALCCKFSRGYRISQIYFMYHSLKFFLHLPSSRR